MATENFTIGGNGSGLGLAFLFNPAPLVFNGQAVAPNLVFSEPQVAAQVDQAQAAYSFTAQTLQNTQNFISSTIGQAYGYSIPIFSSIVASLSNIGTIEANALQTAASNLNKNSGHGLLGFLGL